MALYVRELSLYVNRDQLSKNCLMFWPINRKISIARFFSNSSHRKPAIEISNLRIRELVRIQRDMSQIFDYKIIRGFKND